MLSIRSEFPLFAEHDAHGHLVYLDNGGVTQVPACVTRALASWYAMGNGPVESRTYSLGRAAGDALSYARESVVRFAGAFDAQAVFASSRAAAMTQIALGCVPTLAPGDEIAMPLTEPLDVVLPWQEAARRSGAKLVLLVPDGCGRLSEGELDAKIGPATKVVVCSQAELWFGTLAPLGNIAERAHRVGALTVFDYSLGAAHAGMAAAEDGADMAVLTSSLAFGPRGAAAIVAGVEVLERLDAACFGAKTAGQASERSYRRELLPTRLEAGFADEAAAFGFAAALDYVGELGTERLRAHDCEMTAALLDVLRDVPNIRLYGNMDADEDRLAMISFAIEGFNPVTLASFLGSRGIAVGTNASCLQECSAYLLTTGACHINAVAYNTLDDVAALAKALKAAPFAIGRQAYSRASC